MNKNGKSLLLAAIMGLGCTAHAQQTAEKMVADGHYLGARQRLERFIDNADEHDKRMHDAEALALVCDYVLHTPGTADKIDTWLAVNPTSQYAAPLADLERAQLVREGRTDEALTMFFKAEQTGKCLSCKTIYPYPLTALSDETLNYNRVLFRIAGERFYDTGNYNQAAIYLQQGEKTRGSQYKLGMCHYHMTHYAQAIEQLRAAAGVERDEMAQNAWLHAGLSALQTGSRREAQMAFQQASEITSGNAAVREEALYNYAMSLHDGGNIGFGQSVGVMERFLNDYPQSEYAALVSQHLTEVYFTTKNYKAALASMNKIKQPNAEILRAKQRVLYNLGVQELTGGNVSGALNYANQSVALGKRDAEALAQSYYLKGESEYRQGNYAAAAKDLRQALPNDQATYTLGYALFKQQRYSQALPQFESFANSATGKEKTLLASDAWNRIGDCQLAARSYDKAYASYQRSIDTANAQGDYSLLQQAYIQGLKGNYDEKVELLERMKTEFANSGYAADALFEQGRAYVQQGKMDAASATFHSLRDSYPQSAQARKAGNEIAMLLAESGKKDEAIAAYKSVIAEHPTTEEAQTALANLKDLYTAQGRVNEYLELAGSMGKTFTDDELDGMVREAAIKAMTDGNYRQAQQHYEQLKAQTPSDDTRREAQLGLMRSAYQNADFATAAASATVVVDEASRFSPDVKAEARMTRAESYFKLGNPQAAVADLQELARDSVTVYGAQGTVRLAQYGYETKQYDSTETILTNFIDTGTTHTYWLARAFVLLSDIYTAQGRTIEAQQTLLSLQSSYTESDEINKMIEERLKKD